MDIRFLESFVMVADSGSIASAARRLNLSPAAVSQRLKGLEQDLGHALVQRVGRTVRPTEAGLAVLDHARKLIEGARDLRALAGRDEPAGQLRLGATATALTGLMPAIVAELRAHHSRVEYFIRPGSSIELYQAVTSGELDAAMIVQPHFSIPKSSGWLTLCSEPLILIAPEEMPLHDLRAILTSQPFIRYDRNQWGGQIIDRYLRRNRLMVKEWLELDALDAIAVLVSRGLGIAIVPDWTPPWPEGLRIQKLELDGTSRPIGVLWNRYGACSAATRAFVEMCRDHAVPLNIPL
ncbi:MAG TPA: LysR family transcriptional regulator [Kiloniellales bacterium]|nr:LysR family transcriptional regulator [Kiloniellales bacterium]